MPVGGLVNEQFDLVIAVNDYECVCVVAVAIRQLLSLGRSSVISLVVVLIDVDDYRVGYNLTSLSLEDLGRGCNVSLGSVYVVCANQLAGVRPVVADCNVTRPLVLLDLASSRRYDSEIIVSLLVRAR